MNLLEQIVIQSYEEICKKGENVPNIEHVCVELMSKNGLDDAKFHEYLNELRKTLNKLNFTYEESGKIENPVITKVW